MTKIKDKKPNLNFTVGSALKTIHTAKKAPRTSGGQPIPAGRAKRSRAEPSTHQESAQPKDTLEEPTPGKSHNTGSSRDIPGGLKQPNSPDYAVAPSQMKIDPPPEPCAEIVEAVGTDGLPPINPTHQNRYRHLSARNAQIGSKDAELQTRLVNETAGAQYGDKWFLKPDPPPPPVVIKPALNNHFNNLENIEHRLLEQLSETPVDNDASQTLSGKLADPNNTFVQPIDGASGVTRIMGDFVLKGYADQDQAEIEWVGTKLMQLSGEDTPDMLLGTQELREQVMAVAPDYKQHDIVKNTLNPRRLEPNQPLYNTEITPVTDPLHCLIMPRVYGTNLVNIVQEPKLVSSFKENIDVHIREMSRKAYKDILLGNSDRILRMHSTQESPPYLPSFEEVEAKGSQMNGGNIMFQTVDGEVLPRSAIAIDNYGHSRNHLTTDEGQKKELTVFEYYLNDIQHTAQLPPEEVFKEQHITSFIVSSLKLGMEDMSYLHDKSPLEISDKEVLSLVKEGIQDGWNQINESSEQLDEFLQSAFTKDAAPTEKTLAYTNTLRKKLEILKRTLKPSL